MAEEEDQGLQLGTPDSPEDVPAGAINLGTGATNVGTTGFSGERLDFDVAVDIALENFRQTGIPIDDQLRNQALARSHDEQFLTNPLASRPIPYVSDGSVESDIVTGLTEIEFFDKLTLQNLLTSAHALMYSPEVINAYNDHVEYMGTPAGVLDALHSNISEEGMPAEDVLQDVEQNDVVAQLFHEFGNLFTQEERDFYIMLLASMPKLAQESTGAAIGRLAARLIGFGSDRQNNRSQIAGLMIEWLRNNDISTDEGRKEFQFFAFEAAQKKVLEAEAEAGILGQTGEAIIAPFRTISSQVSNVAAYIASPADFAHRQHVSFGQNMALSMGYDPAEDQFETVSGSWDLVLNLSPADPINLVAGASAGIRAAKLIPRATNISRGRQIWQGLIPFAGRRQGLPFMGRGSVARLTYNVTSRSIDDFVKTKPALRAWDAMSGISDTEQLLKVFPQLETAPKLTIAIAEESEPWKIQELVRGAMHGAGIFEGSPIINPVILSNLERNTAAYISKRDKLLRSGDLGLGHAAHGVDQVNIAVDGVWVPSIGSVLDPLTRGDVSGLARGVATDPGVLTRVLANTRRLIDPKNLRPGQLALEDGRRVEVFTSGKQVAITVDGEHAGGVVLSSGGASGQIGVLPKFAFQNAKLEDGKGLSSVLADVIGRAGLEALAKSEAVSDDAAKFLVREAATLAERQEIGPGTILRATDLNGNGGRKAIISRLDQTFEINTLKHGSDEVGSLMAWLGELDIPVAERLIDTLGQLDDINHDLLRFIKAEEIEVLQSAMRAGNVDAIRVGDSMLVADGSVGKLLVGTDHARDASKTALELLQSETLQMANTQMLLNSLDMESKIQWVISDMPRIEGFRTVAKTKVIPQASRVPSFLRRWKAQFTDFAPREISLVNPAEGRTALRGWMRILGADQQLQNKWLDQFLRADTSSARKRIVEAAMRETGEQIDHPLLKHGLVQWNDKRGNVTYMFDRLGKEMGAVSTGADSGKVLPIYPMHFEQNFAMPDPSSLLASIRRYGSAKGQRKIMPLLNRGLFGKTRQIRKDLATKYRGQIARTQGKNIANQMSNDDLLAIAYSDVLSGTRGRASGAGVISKAINIAGTPIKMLHNIFTTSMLAFRPLSWSGRVLLEETIRANMVGMPNFWGRPAAFMNDWMDARHVRRMPAQFKRTAKQAGALIDEVFDPTKLDKFVLDDIKRLIPKIEEVAAEVGIRFENTNQLKALVASIVGKELTSGNVTTLNRLGMRGNVVRRAALNRSTGRLKKTTDLLKERGLKASFNFEDDVSDIALRSMSNMYTREVAGATQIVDWIPGQMSAQLIDDYGYGLGRLVNRSMEDPIMRYGLGRALARVTGGESVRFSADNLIATKWWRELKPNVTEVADSRGWVYSSDLDLAARYLDEMVDESVEVLFGHFWKGLPNELQVKESVLEGAMRGRFEVATGDEVFRFTKGSYQSFVDETQRYAQTAFLENRGLPPKIAAYFDPRFGQKAEDTNFYRRITDWSLQTFGEKATQRLNRQPAWLDSQKRWFTRLKNMGWDDATAADMANMKATEITNYVFFNTQSQNMFLRRMNKVIPFFGAWWEVLSTWTHKIPSQMHLFVGYADTFRRTNRFMQSLVKSGLVSQEGDTGFRLNLSAEPSNNTEFGRALSKVGHTMMRAPITAIEHIGGIANVVRGSPDFEPADLSAWAKDDFSIGIGNPLDLNDQGVMAVNQWGFGLTPGLSLASTKLFNMLPFALDEELFDVNEPTSLVEVIGDQNVPDFLARNERVLEAALGEDVYQDLLEGNIENLSDLIIPAGTHFTLPNSSLLRTLINENLYPFGKQDTYLGTAFQVVPSTSLWVMKGLGLYLNDDDPSAGIIGYLTGGIGRYQIGSEIIGQIQYLEATEGLVTQHQAALAKVAKFWEKATGRTASEFTSTQLELNLADEDLNTEYRKLVRDAERLSSEIVIRSTDNAGGALIMRGLLGFFLPATPRMQFDQQRQVNAYWSARDLAEDAKARGSLNFAESFRESRFRTPEEMDKALELTSLFLNDKTGDSAIAWLRESHPGLLPFTQGKTFWAPGGPPAGVRGIDDFFSDVEAGNRQVYAPDVFMQKLQRTAIQADKEIAIIAEWGNKPEDQVRGMLTNPLRYEEIQAETNGRYDVLDWDDELHNAGAYRDWKNRNEAESLNLVENLDREVNEIRSFLDEAEFSLNFLTLSPEDRRTITSALNRGYGELRAVIRRVREQAQIGEGFQNPREVLYGDYWDQVRQPYYDERGTLYDQINSTDSKLERDVLYDKLTKIATNDWARRAAVITSTATGEQLAYPTETRRAWDAMTPEEQEQRKLDWIGGKPEWLHLQATELLIRDHPAAAAYLPQTANDFVIYQEVADLKEQVMDAWRRADLTLGERNKLLGKANENLTAWLVENGREGEAIFGELWPIQRLAITGKLPQSLQPVLEAVNEVRGILRANEKGPGSDMGQKLSQVLINWLEATYFVQNPQAANELDDLGLNMFDEALRAAVYPKLLFGEFFGTIEAVEG